MSVPYGYKCVDCGLEQDFTFKMGEAPLTFVYDERVRHHFQRVFSPPMIQGDTVSGGVSGGSGDGYVVDSRTGWTSIPGKQVKPGKNWIKGDHVRADQDE